MRFTTGCPDQVRTAAVKPAPVNSLNRSSAFKSASAFFASKLCRVSPVRSITIYVAIEVLRCQVPEFYAQLRLARKLTTPTR